jgi:hypothetical protein
MDGEPVVHGQDLRIDEQDVAVCPQLHAPQV